MFSISDQSVYILEGPVSVTLRVIWQNYQKFLEAVNFCVKLTFELPLGNMFHIE